MPGANFSLISCIPGGGLAIPVWTNSAIAVDGYDAPIKHIVSKISLSVFIRPPLLKMN